MALYLISYDIAEKDKAEYAPLLQKLSDLGAKQILYSVWMLATAKHENAAFVYDQISPLTSDSDGLLVQEVTTDAKRNALRLSESAFRDILRKARS